MVSHASTCRDLAVDLRIKMGDWFQTSKLLTDGEGGGGCGVGQGWGQGYTVFCDVGDDTIVTQAWNAIGDYYFDRQVFDLAVAHYSKASNYQQMAECYYRLEDFDELKKLVEALPPNNPTLEVNGGRGLWVWSDLKVLIVGCRQEVCVCWHV